MSVKITKKFKVLKLIEQSREDFKDELRKVIGPEILKTLEGGNNPIKAGKQQKYSKSYLKQIKKNGLGVGKRPSPVNLILTGKMLKSIQTKETVMGVKVTFTDEKAEWHNTGVPENNLPPRRLLPSNDGEEFNRNIFNRIMEVLKKVIKKNL